MKPVAEGQETGLAASELADREGQVDFYARLVADHCSDIIIVTDAQGRTEWVNAAFRAFTGYALDDVRGVEPGSILQGEGTDPDTVRAIEAAMADRRPIDTEILNYKKDGSPFWIGINITPVFSPDGRHTHFLAVQRDITERRSLEDRTRAVFEAEEFQQSERALLAQMSEWLYSAKSLEELLVVVRLSLQTLMPEVDGALYIYAHARDTLERAACWGDGPSPDFVTPDSCWSLRRGRAYFYGSQAIQLPCGHVPSHDHPFFCLPIIAQGETIGLLHLTFTAFRLSGPSDGRAHDEFLRQRWQTALTCAEQISLAIANVQLRLELEEKSVRDQLTGLWNRRWFQHRGKREIRAALDRGEAYSLIALDVDHFKRFNDSYGHDAGDAVLREVAQAMRSTLASEVAACRIGGEEFAVLAPATDIEGAELLAEGVREAIGRLQIQREGTALPRVTISAGVATAPEAGDTIDALLRSADRALYAAKAAGRDLTMTVSEAEAFHSAEDAPEAVSGADAIKPDGSDTGAAGQSKTVQAGIKPPRSSATASPTEKCAGTKIAKPVPKKASPR